MRDQEHWSLTDHGGRDCHGEGASAYVNACWSGRDANDSSPCLLDHAVCVVFRVCDSDRMDVRTTLTFLGRS